MTVKILDPCFSSRMMHFDRQNSNLVFVDIRTEKHIFCDGRSLDVTPDIEMDFHSMPFKDETFLAVVFDPRHLLHVSDKSWLTLKYGKLG